MFAPPHADEGWDTDADNRFEFLVVNVTVSVTLGGDFTVDGKLFDSTGVSFITGNSTAFSGAVGLHVVSINLEGRDIFGSRIDGPYRVNLDLLNDTLVLVDIGVHFTAPYSHVAFGPIFAFTPPHTDVGLDTDGNTQFNFIQVNVSVNTSLPGFFFVFGFITGMSGVMDFKVKLLNLTAGDHVIPFNFSGVGAFINGDDGPYDVFLSASVIDCGRDRSGEGDNGNHTTALYFFTEFEFGIKRALTGSVTNGTTGQPVANETVWLTNQTHRWLTTFETNATGNFSFVAFMGDFILMTGAEGLQDEARPITIVADTNVDVTLGEEDVEASKLDLALTDWGNLTVRTDMFGYADNQSQRFLVDQFVGNGDLSVDATESDQWIELFRNCFTPFNDTTGQFEVDGIPFALDNGTFVMDADLTGPVTSTAPILQTMDMNLTSQSPIPVLGTHEVFFRANYDNENETEVATLTFPSAWVLDSFWPVSNVTVGPLNDNTITIDPLGRPSGDPPSVGVVMNATFDTTPPLLSSPVASPDPQEVFGVVAISATVTDNSGVASVWAHILAPSGGLVCNCSMAGQAGSDVYTYATSFGVLGVYTFTVWAEDDAGLFTSGSGSFTIQDTTPPFVGAPSASPNPQEAGMTVNFGVAVSDNLAVSTVTIAIVDPDALPVGTFPMTTFGGGEWSYARSFTKLGVYTMTVWASDSSGNLASNGGSFTIVDTTAPQIHNHSATPDPQEVFGSVTVFANVSDNSGVAEVRVNISDPSGITVGNFTMSPLGCGQCAYAAAYGALGTFTYTIWARDDGGLFSSVTGSFIIEDTTLPTLGAPSASPNPQEAGQPVNFTVAVSDNFAVDTVTISIRDPSNALLGNFTMTGGPTYTYSATYIDTGTYTYTVWANDTSGNLDSRGGQFTVQDTTPPQVVAALAAPNPQEVGQDITLTADVADVGGIAAISVRIEDPSGALVGNFTMAAVDADTYDYTLALGQLGVYNFTVWVTDGAGLVGSRSGDFTIQDTTAPSIGLPTANPDPQQLGQNVAFSVQVTDNDAVDAVTIAIEDPAANPVGNVSMTLVGGTFTHSESFNAPGTYSYTIWAADASGNLASRGGTFVIEDTEPPLAVISGPTEVDVDASFSLNGGASSDNHRIANYTWDLGDGTLSYGPTVTHAYDVAGDYTVTLTVRDDSGNEDAASLPITVLAAAPEGGGFPLSDTTLYALLAALAVAGITAGVLYWWRGARAAGTKGPPTGPEGKAEKKPRAKASKKPPKEPPEPELDELDREIEDLLKP